MKNSRLYSVFQSLHGEEISQVRKFLQSPYFNQRQDVLDLFECLVENRRSGGPVPEREAVFAKVFPEEAFDDQRMRHVMSFLLKNLEEYLTCTILFEDEVYVQTRLAEAYRRRNLVPHFQRSLKKAQRMQTSGPYRHADHYWNGYEIQRQYYLLTATTRRATELNLQETGDQLDLAFLTLKLRQGCVALSHQAVFKTEYDFGLLPVVLTHIEQNDLLAIPAIGVYYHCYFALTEPEEPAHFHNFKDMLNCHGDAFPVPEVRDLYLLGINYCIRRYNEGDAAFLKAELELYRAALEKNILLVNGILSRFTYQNIVTLGLVLREFDWVEGFIQQYTSVLSSRFREANYAFNLARLAYERCQYDKALDLLQKSDYEDLLLNLSAKALLLKVYYETAEYNALDSLLDSMTNFVRRKKALGYHRAHYLNLCRFMRRLLAVRPSDGASIEILKRELSEATAVAERAWLLQKMEEL